jgi:hypothetical protein
MNPVCGMIPDSPFNIDNQEAETIVHEVDKSSTVNKHRSMSKRTQNLTVDIDYGSPPWMKLSTKLILIHFISYLKTSGCYVHAKTG